MKAFFAGVSDEGSPGAIQIWKFGPLEKINEVQAHSLGVERLKISHDNNYIFSAGKDGTIFIMDIKDREPRGIGFSAKDKETTAIKTFSEEILTAKGEM